MNIVKKFNQHEYILIKNSNLFVIFFSCRFIDSGHIYMYIKFYKYSISQQNLKYKLFCDLILIKFSLSTNYSFLLSRQLFEYNCICILKLYHIIHFCNNYLNIMAYYLLQLPYIYYIQRMFLYYIYYNTH